MSPDLHGGVDQQHRQQWHKNVLRDDADQQAAYDGSRHGPGSHRDNEPTILTEHRATNTGENVIFSLPILEARLGLANIHSLIALGKATTSVRYLMTLHRHWPQVRKMLVTVNHLPYPMEEWPKHPELRDKVLAEWRKVAAYRDLGFISDWP